MSGTLILVGTPIGNMGDLSPRAKGQLGSADLICCEDTRRTRQLLRLAGIDHPKLLMVNDHNEATVKDEVVERLDVGQQIAVVTDAGMPGIADPGERLVAAAIAAGHRIEVVPGPSAGIAAIVGSGLSTGRYVFEGFLPRKGSARHKRLELLASEERTIVVYEAPHRLGRLLKDLVQVFGKQRLVVVARELTKFYEEFWRGTLDDALIWTEEASPRGEIVVIIEGMARPIGATEVELRSALIEALDTGMSKSEASRELAREFSVSKRQVYDLAVTLDP